MRVVLPIDLQEFLGVFCGLALPGVEHYAFGPRPDFSDSMVVTQVASSESLGTSERSLAGVRVLGLFSVFDRRRQVAMDLGRRVVVEAERVWRAHERVSLSDGDVFISRLRVDELPVFHNDQLVNDSQIARVDCQLEFILRRV